MNLNVKFLKLLTSALKRVSRKMHNYFPVDGFVLMYHEISNEPLDAEEDCRHYKKDFVFQISSFIECGYVFLSADDFYSEIRKKSKRRFCLLTFDDAYSSVYKHAWPYLKENNIPFILFLSTKFLDQEGMLSTKEIEEMLASGLCTIGGHTENHLFLKDVRDVNNEMMANKIFLEKKFYCPVNYFAYPYGKAYVVGLKAVIKASRIFKMSFHTEVYGLDLFNVHFRNYLPRIVVTNDFCKKLERL